MVDQLIDWYEREFKKELTDEQRDQLSQRIIKEYSGINANADPRGNAVFLMVAGKPNRPIGAELRGTGPRIWHGLALGTSRDAGYFWVGSKGSQTIVLCESAIDAISCFQLDPRRICISTAGVRANPRWLRALLARGYRVHCGFDTDEVGEEAATRMLPLHPRVQRLRPPAHDWNDALTAGQ